MRIRRRVEAEFALTNTLGIRDNLYSGPITLEDMFNVFPFENTINIMYLSGRESMSCSTTPPAARRTAAARARARLPAPASPWTAPGHRQPGRPTPARSPTTARPTSPAPTNDTRSPWQCLFPNGGDSRRAARRAQLRDPRSTARPSTPTPQYKVAVNDYIARGGSGFKVLQAQHHPHRDQRLPARRPD